MTRIRSVITGCGGYLPETVLTNNDLAKIVDTSDEWIRDRTGISERHIAADDEFTVDLAEQAARKAIDAAGIAVEDIDLIIVATTTPDRVFPSTACLLQKRLDRHGCAAFDIQAVCTGFVYALAVADKFVRTGAAKCALVVGAETLSRVLDWTDRGTCVLFGDGAGAVVLEASEEAGILSTHLHADGAYEHLLSVSGGISQGYDSLKEGNGYVTMKGNDPVIDLNEVFKRDWGGMGSFFGGKLDAEGSARVIRFANRVPLLHQPGACAMSQAVTRTNWRSYDIEQPRGGMPVGPLAIFVHMASVWVPFTSESKEAVAHYPEIIREIRLGLQECGRRVGEHLGRERRAAEAARKVFNGFEMIWRATDLGRIKSVATIPCISTHQQQGDEGRRLAAVPPNLIRLSVGGEHPDDIVDDLDRALSLLKKASVATA